MVRKGKGDLMFSGRLGKVGPFLKVECLQLVISSSLHLKTNPQLLSLGECIFANDRVVQDPCFTFLLSVTPIRVLGMWVFFPFCNCLIEKQVPFHFKPPHIVHVSCQVWGIICILIL